MSLSLIEGNKQKNMNVIRKLYPTCLTTLYKKEVVTLQKKRVVINQGRHAHNQFMDSYIPLGLFTNIIKKSKKVITNAGRISLRKFLRKRVENCNCSCLLKNIPLNIINIGI